MGYLTSKLFLLENNNATIVLIAVNLAGVILCIEIRELCTLYVYIYICLVVFKSFYFILAICQHCIFLFIYKLFFAHNYDIK